MKRVMIIGCCGSGKSTLSKKIYSQTGLPLFHLDQYYWKPNWTESEENEWKATVQQLADQDEWIIDGNYGGTMNIRLERADTIIFMDYPAIVCLWRVLKRIWKYHGKVRPDMPEGCRERLDFEFLHYVATYNLLRRRKLMEMLQKVDDEKSVFILSNDSDIREMMKKLSQKPN